MSWKGREERKGYRAEDSLQTPRWSMGSVLMRKAGTNQVAHSSILSCSCRLRQFGFMTIDSQRWFSFYFSFLLQTFSSNFLWWTFEIHKKAESKINNLLLDSQFLIFCYICYIYICANIHLLILNLDIFTLLYLDIFTVLFIFGWTIFFVENIFFLIEGIFF